MLNFSDNFFKTAVTGGTPCRGKILVAEPLMVQDFFTHSVVALIDHNPDSDTTGVVLNYASPYMLHELIEGVEETTQHTVYFGGPLGRDRLFFLHTLGPEVIPDCIEFAPGIYAGGDFEAAIEFVNSGYPVDGHIRFFVGYSGWVAGQLQDELDNGAWALTDIPTPADTLLSGRGDAMWHRAVRRLGPEYRGWTLLPRDFHAN